MRLSYLLPTLFVAGLIVGAPLACLFFPLRIAYLAAVGTYGALTFLSSIHTHPAMWLATWLGVVATHLVYGVRFFMGLFTRRMPCEVATFDHPAEKE
jgi:hypothetical protein